MVGRRVMQVARDAAPFLFLYAHELSGEASQLLFGMLSSFDIGVRPIPPYDASFGIALWYPACQVPPVGAIPSPMTFLLFVRRSSCHRLAPSLKHPVSVLGMKHSLPAIASQVFQPQSRAGAPPLVAVVKCAVRRAAPDLLRDCVDQGLVASLHLPRTLHPFYPPSPD